MDRLRRLLYEEAEEQRKQHTKDMRKTYRDQLREIQQEQEREKAAQHKRKMPVNACFRASFSFCSSFTTQLVISIFISSQATQTQFPLQVKALVSPGILFFSSNYTLQIGILKVDSSPSMLPFRR